MALNSVLNGRLARELGFEQTFIPAYPGDDGIAGFLRARARACAPRPEPRSMSPPRKRGSGGLKEMAQKYSRDDDPRRARPQSGAARGGCKAQRRATAPHGKGRSRHIRCTTPGAE